MSASHWFRHRWCGYSVRFWVTVVALCLLGAFATLGVRLLLSSVGSAKHTRYEPVDVPPECDSGHVYHLFPILSSQRSALQAHLSAEGIGTLIHYPIPIPRQPALSSIPSGPCPVADRVCREVCSLPLHPALPPHDAGTVASAIHAWRTSPSIAHP